MSIESKLIEVAENVPKVYKAGYDKGKAEGGGGEDALKVFWDNYQQWGTRNNYAYAFAGAGWTNDTFKPQYDLKPTANAMNMFNNSRIQGDLGTYLERCGVVLDLSGCTNVSSIFSGSKYITHLPRLDIRKATSAASLFSACSNLKEIETIVVGERNTNGTGWFNSCSSLESVTFEGDIFANIDLKQCPKLNRASIEILVGALSTVKSGGTITLSQTAKEAAFTDDEWKALTDTKPNWRFTLM